MNRTYRIHHEPIVCPSHGPAQFEGRVWEGNLLQEVDDESLKVADVHGQGILSCGCPVEINWYAAEHEPNVTLERTAE